MDRLLPQETRLVGNLRLIDDRVVTDDVCARMNRLIETYLQQVKVHESGWDILFPDPNDGRYWELTHHQSGSQGGGPPSFICLSSEMEKAKYEFSD